MTIAEERLFACLTEYQDRVLATWRGYEKLLVFELARALDVAAFSITMRPNDEPPPPAYDTMLLGAATAFRPLFPGLADAPSGVPWIPTTDELSRGADGHLMYCGRFANLQRIAALEYYGLSHGTIVGPNRLVLEVKNSQVEREEAETLHAMQQLPEDPLLRLFPDSRKLLRRFNKCVGVDREHFIRYGSDDALTDYYHALASKRAIAFLEGEALPSDAVIGGRPFSLWHSAAIAASARVLRHIAFAVHLAAKHSKLNIRNLLTIFARTDDAADVLRDAGEAEIHIAPLFAAMTLDEISAGDTIDHYEVPLPFYIDYGPDFVLLPCFGTLLNPVAAMVRYLKINYRRDWDRAVARREEVFRADLRKLFPEPRFHVAPKGALLYRPDGSQLTDIDAMVLDRQYGSLALMQLKWHDIYGRSLRERNSRRLNLLHANEWVERVAGWVDGRSAALVAATILKGESPAAADEPPHLFVVSRYNVQFTQNDPYDLAAAWMGWADIVKMVRDEPRVDVLGELFKRFRGGRHSGDSPSQQNQVATYALPSLTVDVRVV